MIATYDTGTRTTLAPAALAPLASTTAAVDLPRIEAAVREMLLGLGEDPDREGLAETPRRVARAMAEMTAGLRQHPATHLGRVFTQDSEEAVVVRDIEFYSLCEHHLLPFTGKVHLAYIPANGKVVGLSKLARTVDVFARRPQMQERLTNQIADALAEHTGARGVAVLLEGEHYCMKMRGAAQRNSRMLTSAFRGSCANDLDQKAVVLSMLTDSRRLAAALEDAARHDHDHNAPGHRCWG